MANIKQARKRVLQNNKSRKLNSSQKSTMRTYIKRVNSAVAAGDADGARIAFDRAQPLIDRAARKGLIHKNKAARTKSKLAGRIRAIAS